MNVIATLARLEEERAEEMENLRQCADSHSEFVDEAEDRPDSNSPVYDLVFIDGGSEAVSALTNFSDAEFHVLWSMVEEDVTVPWTTGRGKKCAVKPKDAFLMGLTVLKHYSAWDKHAMDFSLKTSRFEKMIMKLFTIIEKPLFQRFIHPVSMAEQRVRGQQFTNYPYALYATDVKFQPAHRPSGRFEEQKRYFSNKH